MSQSATGAIKDTIGGTAHKVADSVDQAAGQVQKAVNRAQGGIGEARDAVRAQPIVATLVVFATGYLLGRFVH